MTPGSPPNTPSDLHSLWARLDFTQTCLTRKRICLTAGLTEPIFRTATARSEPAAQLAAGGKKLERTGGRAPAHVWSRFGTDGWRMTSKAQLWTWQAATATVFESSSPFYLFIYFLSRLFGPFRSVFISIFLFPATPGIRPGRASPRWHGNFCRSPLDVDIYEMCIFMSAWWYSTWQLLILAPLIPEKFLRNAAQKSPPRARVVYLSPYILIQSICLCSHLVENLMVQMGVISKKMHKKKTQNWRPETKSRQVLCADIIWYLCIRSTCSFAVWHSFVFQCC